MKRLLFKLLGATEQSLKRSLTMQSPAIIVLGFERSGTSLVCQMLASAGVHFGAEQELMRSDFRNPKGFYEHRKIFKSLRQMLKEARLQDEVDRMKGLRAKGVWNRMRRFFTRLKLMRAIQKLSIGSSRWGIKSFPILFYLLRPYLQRVQIVAIFRGPHAVVESFMHAWPKGSYPADQILERWYLANRDLLYHVLANDGILIKYEDLLGGASASVISQVSRVLNLDQHLLAQAIDPKLNRSDKFGNAVVSKFTLPEHVARLVDELDALRVK